MDIESLYPSLRTEDCVELVRYTIVNSDIDVSIVNLKEMMVFMRKFIPVNFVNIYQNRKRK